MASESGGDEIVRLAHALNPVEAHIWEEALQQEGIRCRVSGDFLDVGIGNIPGLMAEVWVQKKDLARAQEILRRVQEEARVEESEDEAQGQVQEKRLPTAGDSLRRVQEAARSDENKDEEE
jgi:hypothetical protein